MVIKNFKYVIMIAVYIMLSINVSLNAQTQENNLIDGQTALNTPAIANDSLTIDSANIKMFIDKIEVNVQLEKPQAMFILPGSTPDIDDIQIEHSFFNEIFRPVEKRGRIQSSLTTEPAIDRKDYIPW
ncbi:MAG TPA: hypothetical protein PLP19_15335 [bacterium]|nr:hypothetical protein [bacterium]HPN44864.1 hypothetical protein [bacterium]